MDTFAVIKIGGRQYKVSKGDTISVERFDTKDTKKVTFSEVLLKAEGDKVTVGTPYIKNAVVEAKILGEDKGKKVSTRIYKAKSRYRRASGHRAKLIRLEITKI